MSETIAKERTSLLQQLELLKNMNKKLRDDKDEIEERINSQVNKWFIQAEDKKLSTYKVQKMIVVESIDYWMGRRNSIGLQ